MQILIVDKANVVKRAEAFRPTHAVVFQTAEDDTDPIIGVLPKNAYRTKINKKNNASLKTMTPLIEFVRNVPADARLLFRCDAGVSRSATGALLAMCLHAPDIDIEDHFKIMRASWPHVVPQRGMLRLTDDILGLKGRLVLASQHDTAERMLSLPILEFNADDIAREINLPNVEPKSWRRIFKSWLLKLAHKI